MRRITSSKNKKSNECISSEAVLAKTFQLIKLRKILYLDPFITVKERKTKVQEKKERKYLNRVTPS